MQPLAKHAHERVARRRAGVGADQAHRRAAIVGEVHRAAGVLLRIERHLERSAAVGERRRSAVDRATELVEARIHRHAAEPTLVVRAQPEIRARDHHLRGAALRTALRVEARHRMRRAVHEWHPARRELLAIRRHLQPRRASLVLRAHPQKQVVDAVLVGALHPRARSDAEAPLRKRQPRAHDHVARQVHARHHDLQALRLVRHADRHRAPRAQQRDVKLVADHQLLRVVHLEQLCRRLQAHAQTLAGAVLAKRRIGQIAHAHAHALAARPADDEQVERRREVVLARHLRPVQHDRARLGRLGRREHELTVAQQRARRAQRAHRRAAIELLLAREVERHHR